MSELTAPDVPTGVAASVPWARCLLGHDLGESPAAIGWSSCGTWLAAATVLGKILVLEVESDRQIACWDAHEEGVLALAWHPQHSILASSGKDGCVRLWQIDASAVVKIAEVVLLAGAMSRWVELLSWRNDGKQLAIAHGNRVVLCSQLGVVEQTHVFPGSTIGAMCWRPAGAQLAVAGYGGIRIYSVLNPGTKPQDLKWKGSLLSMIWSPDGKVIAAGCQDNTVHFWRMPEGRDARMSGFEYKPLQICWAKNGKWLATGGSRDLILWPFAKKGPEGCTPLSLEWHDQAICAIAATTGRPRLASGCRAGRIAIWENAGDERPLACALLDSRVEHLQWSPHKNTPLLAASSRDGILSVWDTTQN
ncbi:MAG: WD40 repeat domain-containing protein [Gammaproteobacteria bacterium]|nr:WD40 repeat domain-containing protein [Gammaproteobacteria bacterium]